MKRTIRLASIIACLALTATACGKKDDDNKPAPKTTAPPPTAPEAPKPKTTEDHVAAVNAAWDAFNKGDIDGFKKHFADDVDYEIVDSGQPASKGVDAAMAAVNVFRTAFPDLTGERALILANGNHVVTVDLMTGTHKGELMGVPASDKKAGLLVAHAFTFNDKGQVQNEQIYFDAATLMGQLGVHKMPHRAAMEATGTNATAVIAANDDKEKANLEAATKMGDLFAANKFDEAMALMADDVVMSDQTMPEDMADKAKMKAMMDMWSKAFSDSKFEVEWAWAAGDYVVRAASWSGTNTGAMPEMGLKKATNKPMKMRFLEVIEFADGKAKKAWSFSNGMAVATQLGLIEAPK